MTARITKKCGRCNGSGYRWSIENTCWHCGGSGDLKKENKATKHLMYSIALMVDAQPRTVRQFQNMYRLEHTTNAIQEAISELVKYQYITETNGKLEITAFGKDRVAKEEAKRLAESRIDWIS